jgi:hypothetical protein
LPSLRGSADAGFRKHGVEQFAVAGGAGRFLNDLQPVERDGEVGARLRELFESLQHTGRIALAVEAPEEDSLAPVRAAPQPLAEQRGLAQPAQSGDGDEPYAWVGCPGIAARQHVEAPGELLVLRGLVDEALASLCRGRRRYWDWHRDHCHCGTGQRFEQPVLSFTVLRRTSRR